MRDTYFTKQGLADFATAALASFGLLSAVFQIALAIWPSLAHHAWLTLGSLASSCLVAGLVHRWPQSTVEHSYTYPNFVIRIKQGDILEESGNVIIGFTDTFDTDISDGVVIDPRSVQGQFQLKYYPGVEALDLELERALGNTQVIARESLTTKARGKLSRYEIGTVAVLNEGGARYYALAYGYMRNDMRVSCSVDAIWRSLSSVWDAVRTHGRLDPVAIPVIGSELARVGSLDRSSLIKMIALSFVASSRQEVVSRELLIIIHPKDRRQIRMNDLDRFLRAL
ncbi:macro domain-containing protein [Actinomadura montaniterrae]|uniref:Thoeris protein ThsA Macro domain-containing protein n=1 Tax=Actinomadura montaniterrae TaxID=1803903 RepID=A0A6L3VJG3_9ACTN|nr:macro domain-containing protein [Actinomadura montaniterrae]KAB2371005.1 hypothetical protein F9B16_33355 [Actinomadura montaniterrae]